MTTRSNKTVRKTAEPGKRYAKDGDLREAARTEALRQLGEIWRSAGYAWAPDAAEELQYRLGQAEQDPKGKRAPKSKRARAYVPWAVGLEDVALLAERIKLQGKIASFERGQAASSNPRGAFDELLAVQWRATSMNRSFQVPLWRVRLRQVDAEIEARGLLEDEADRTEEQRLWRKNRHKKQYGTRARVCDDSEIAGLVPKGIDIDARFRALLSLAFGNDFPKSEKKTVASVIDAEMGRIRDLMRPQAGAKTPKNEGSPHGET